MSTVVSRRPGGPSPTRATRRNRWLFRTAAAAGAMLAGSAALAGASAAQDTSAALARADAAWKERGEGHVEYVAAPGPVAEAITRYEAALTLDPESLETRWKLMRALHFAGDYAADRNSSKLEIFDRARQVSEDGVRVLQVRLGEDERPEEIDAEDLRQALAASGASTVEVARFYFWSGVAWGAWGREAGILGAVRQGVAGRMLRYMELAQSLEPGVEDGGVYRVLSTMHRQLPRIPFLTGWVDRDQAVPLMEQGLAIAPEDRGNRYLMAVTLLDLDPERHPEALAVLREIAELEPEQDRVVEDLQLRHRARKRLAEELEKATTELAEDPDPGRVILKTVPGQAG